MNTKEIIDGLEEINYSLPHSLIPDKAIDLIESLQAQLELEHGGALAAAENCLRLQGEVNDLQAQLAKEKRRCRELEKALLDMTVQFSSHGDRMKHAFMTAEETAYDLLDIDYGERISSVYKRYQEKWRGDAEGALRKEQSDER